MDLLRQYHDFAFWLEVQCGGDKILHLHIGLAIWCLSALITRRSLRSRLPLILILIPEFINEGIDYIIGDNWSFQDTIMDVLSTMTWPVLLFILINYQYRKRIIRRTR